MPESTQPGPASAANVSRSTGPRWARAATIGAMLLGLVLGAALALEIFVVERLPVLTVEALDAAEKLWQEKGPPGYNLDLTIEGAQPGVVHVEVRGGIVTAMQRDGLAPSQRRTWDVWAVPGMFETIERELQLAADPEHEMNAAVGTRVELRAEFDPTYGYPARYHRITYGGGPEVYWRVTDFQPQGT